MSTSGSDQWMQCLLLGVALRGYTWREMSGGGEAPGDSCALLTPAPFQNLAEGFLRHPPPQPPLLERSRLALVNCPSLFFAELLPNEREVAPCRLQGCGEQVTGLCSFWKSAADNQELNGQWPCHWAGDKGGARERNSAGKLSSALPPWSRSLREEMRRKGGLGRTDAAHKVGTTGAPGTGDANPVIKASRHLL